MTQASQTGGVERSALRASAYGAFLMAVIGLAFAWLTGSEAILLDGVFSGISFMMAILTLRVAHLVAQPDDEHFHYGYAHFAPLLNVIKSLLMIVLCGFALAAAVSSLLGGGRPLQVGSAVIYGILSTLGCLGFALYLRRAAARTGSVLVALDAKAWIVDTLMSGAVLVSFCAGYFIARSPYAGYVDYLDPALVTVLCLLALPIPLRVLVQNGREVLLFAPDRALQDQVDELFRTAAAGLGIEAYRIRMLKMGNTLNILVHARLPHESAVAVHELDAVRSRFGESLEVLRMRGVADVVFVGDMAFAD